MRFSENEINVLRMEISHRLSEKRFAHTIGVERAAAKLAMYLDEDESIMRAAALLHDIAKEYGDDEIIEFIKADGAILNADELSSPAILHAYAAPFVIKRDFPHFSIQEILSACENHTVGAPDMSIADGIIFIADYIEDGRSYETCIRVREELYSELIDGKVFHNRKMLAKAIVSAINFTEASLLSKKKHINQKMLLTRTAFLSRI